MEIKFECADKINGKVTVVVAKADYEEKVKKTLKDYRKKANIPGFRPENPVTFPDTSCIWDRSKASRLSGKCCTQKMS